MSTFKPAAIEYLSRITPTHTPSTISTYERNFDAVLVPYFGADTPLQSITTTDIERFLGSDALTKKPNGLPRAQPTIDQITGLLRNFMRDAVNQGLIDEAPFPATTTRVRRVLLCSKCRAPLTEPPPTTETAPAATLASSAIETVPAAEPPAAAKKAERNHARPRTNAKKTVKAAPSKRRAK